MDFNLPSKEDLNDQLFRKAFWEWFDALPKPERERFNNYREDMSEVYFFNKYYRHALVTPSATNGEQGNWIENGGSIPSKRSI